MSRAATLTAMRAAIAPRGEDAYGQGLAYVYYEDEPGRRSAAKLLSPDEARRIAADIAMLLETVIIP